MPSATPLPTLSLRSLSSSSLLHRSPSCGFTRTHLDSSGPTTSQAGASSSAFSALAQGSGNAACSGLQRDTVSFNIPQRTSNLVTDLVRCS